MWPESEGVNVLKRPFSANLLFSLSCFFTESVAEGFDVLAVSVPGLTQDVSVWSLTLEACTGGDNPYP